MSARRRPLYARLLGLRHLKLRPAVAFLLFEGSIGLGLLLALADIVNGWGIVAVPVTVAVMVKLNDIVAGGLVQVAHVAPVGVPQPAVSAEAKVPPQNRANQPGRGASMRRTRGIVGRARLGSARGIVYVHPKPPDPRRPDPPDHEPSTALSPGGSEGRGSEGRGFEEGSVPTSGESTPSGGRAAGTAPGLRGSPDERGASSRAGDVGPTDRGSDAGSRGRGSDARSAGREGDGDDADRSGDSGAERGGGDRGSASLDLTAIDPAVPGDGDPPVPRDQTERLNPDRELDRSSSDRTDRNKGRFA